MYSKKRSVRVKNIKSYTTLFGTRSELETNMVHKLQNTIGSFMIRKTD